jgi:hypothetical protein
MGTSCVVARPDGDDFRGRFVRLDGGPATMVPVLLTLHGTLGLDGLGRVLLDEHGGWSTIDPQGKLDPARLVDGSQIVAGVGVAYDDDGWWITRETFQQQWLYVLAGRGINVFAGGGADLVAAGTVRWGSQLTGDVLTAIECGEDFGRCGHTAVVHFPQLAGTDCAGLSPAQVLGRSPIGHVRDAAGFVAAAGTPGWEGVPAGVEVRATGTGGPRGPGIYESVVVRDGRRWTVPTWDLDAGRPVDGVTPIWPDPANPRPTSTA